ncbi:hypothetical protein PTSG_01909 [Salpingoeca rosetta]|uniref:Uncharacterized protein n=1 Tax=Salpingoeca rosetta (strain ATCC 50818 / BSB-021) TaxID=946362 RepID=F2TZB1_SALR5|nr:uncharacterized protein PTSG_01909 [Salpingoeca rosetta]EGD78935.1 hypothetical protein PTSG_01909 [Salpingoeca rosetta]|eukprot:XP_004997891.1 hypothetical protein PTSG_01909 [Salpingoeca rosetta]
MTNSNKNSASTSGTGEMVATEPADGVYFRHGSANKEGVSRRRQWIYLGPVVAAPLTHICVTLYRKTPKKWRPWMAWGGVGGLSFLAVANRLVLMYHAGYPCEDHIDVSKRLVRAGEEQPETAVGVAKDIIKHSI